MTIQTELYSLGIITYHIQATIEGRFNFSITLDDIKKVLADLMFQQQREQISLVTIGPRYVLKPALCGGWMIDYTSAVPILMSKMHFLKVKTEDKGHKFEDAVITCLLKKDTKQRNLRRQ